MAPRLGPPGIPRRSLGDPSADFGFGVDYSPGTATQVMDGNGLTRQYTTQAVGHINMNTKTYDQATARSVESLLRKQPMVTIDGNSTSLYGYLFDTAGRDANVDTQISAINRTEDLSPREKLQLVSILPAFKPKTSRSVEYHTAITNARRNIIEEIHTKVKSTTEDFRPRVTENITFPDFPDSLSANVENLKSSKNSQLTFQKNVSEGGITFEYYDNLDDVDGGQVAPPEQVSVDEIRGIVNNTDTDAINNWLKTNGPGSAKRELYEVGIGLKARKRPPGDITIDQLADEIDKIEDIKAVFRSGSVYSNIRLTDNVGLSSKPPVGSDARDVFDIVLYQQESAFLANDRIQLMDNSINYNSYNQDPDSDLRRLQDAIAVHSMHNSSAEDADEVISVSSGNPSSPFYERAKSYTDHMEGLENTPEGRVGAALAEAKRQIKTDAEAEADRVKGKWWCARHWYVCVPLGVMTGFILIAELAECLGANGGTPEWNKCANPAKERCKRQCFSDWDDPSYWDDGELYGRDADDIKNRTLKALHVGDEAEDSMYQFNTQWGYTMLNEDQSKSGTARYHSRNREAWENVPDKGLYCTTENLKRDPANTTCEGYCEDACADAYPDRGFGSVFGRAARGAVEFGVQSGVEVSKGVFDGIFGDNFFNGLLFLILLLVGFFLYKSFK